MYVCPCMLHGRRQVGHLGVSGRGAGERSSCPAGKLLSLSNGCTVFA